MRRSVLDDAEKEQTGCGGGCHSRLDTCLARREAATLGSMAFFAVAFWSLSKRVDGDSFATRSFTYVFY